MDPVGLLGEEKDMYVVPMKRWKQKLNLSIDQLPIHQLFASKVGCIVFMLI